jgi:hypothetical protein
MGRERCVPTDFGLGTPGSASTTGREITVKCCGIAVVMPQGPSRAPPSSSEITVNAGTEPAYPVQRDRLGAPTVHRSGTGRSRRSTSSRGKPGTWGRAAAPITRYRYRGTKIPNPWVASHVERPTPWRARCMETRTAGSASGLGTDRWQHRHRAPGRLNHPQPTGEMRDRLGSLPASRPHSPIGRGSGLKIRTVWVRVPVGAREEAW